VALLPVIVRSNISIVHLGASIKEKRGSDSAELFDEEEEWGEDGVELPLMFQSIRAETLWGVYDSVAA